MNPSFLRIQASRTQHCPSSAGNQCGAVLFVGLLFLVMLTLLGITALQVSTLEERMAGNSRDRNLAFQAAESALRDAERDIQCMKIDGTAATTLRTSGCISGMAGADSSCTAGLCCNNPGGTALTCLEPTATMIQNYRGSYLNDGAAQSVQYGFYTAAPALTGGLSYQPRYLIEPFLKDKSNYYRITARGYGINPNTQVTLEEIYKGT